MNITQRTVQCLQLANWEGLQLFKKSQGNFPLINPCCPVLIKQTIPPQRLAPEVAEEMVALVQAKVPVEVQAAALAEAENKNYSTRTFTSIVYCIIHKTPDDNTFIQQVSLF